MTRGKSSQYLKDERALENYLIEAGLDETSLQLGGGEVRTGQDLRAVIDTALAVRALIDNLHSRYDKDVVEQAAIAGALNPATMNDPDRAAAAAADIARRLDTIAEETERGWTGERLAEGGLLFERTVRGVKETSRIDAALVG